MIQNDKLLIPVPILRTDSPEFREKLANSTLQGAINRSKDNTHGHPNNIAEPIISSGKA